MKSIFAKTPQSSGKHWVVLPGVGAIVLVLWMLSFAFGDSEHSFKSQDHPRERYRISVIADLDKRSKRSVSGKDHWHSKYMTGYLIREGQSFRVAWDEPTDVVTGHNEAGRGCELSELVLYRRKMYTFDDRTGIMFEVVHPFDSSKPGDNAPALAPRGIFMEGDGNTDKGLKVEWASVKDDKLYVGSFGKEFTNSKGEIQHSNNLWVVEVNPDGTHRNLDWSRQYNAMRQALGYEHPSYLLHEAITWSPLRRQWFVFPRRMSKEPYDEVEDERRGHNTIIVADEDFKNIKAFTVGRVTPVRGFSSAKFLPQSADRIIVALKSEENSELDRQTTYITVYKEDDNGQWRVVMEETELPGEAKFEGLEIFD